MSSRVTAEQSKTASVSKSSISSIMFSENHPIDWENVQVMDRSWLRSTVGRTSVLGRRAFTDLHSPSSWRL